VRFSPWGRCHDTGAGPKPQVPRERLPGNELVPAGRGCRQHSSARKACYNFQSCIFLCVTSIKTKSDFGFIKAVTAAHTGKSSQSAEPCKREATRHPRFFAGASAHPRQGLQQLAAQAQCPVTPNQPHCNKCLSRLGQGDKSHIQTLTIIRIKGLKTEV